MKREMELYRQSVADVVVTLTADAQSGLSAREPQASWVDTGRNAS